MTGTIKHLLYSGNILNLIINFSVFIYFIALIIIYNKFKNDEKNLKIWKLLCLVPLLISIIHLIIFTLGSAFIPIFLMYTSIYLPSVLIALCPLLIKRKVIHKISIVLIFITCLICPLYSLSPTKIINYTRYNLTDAYISLCDYLEKNYIMNEWKKIDYE